MSISGNDAINTSKYFTDTPHNRTTASIPSSAPPKLNHSVLEKCSPATDKDGNDATNFAPQQEESSNDAETVIHFGRDNDEDTIISVQSVQSDTPRVPRKHRNSCVRILSAHKEVNMDKQEIVERTKRLAKTKKKINASEEENEDEVKENKTEKAADDPDDKKTAAAKALEEWEKIRSLKNPQAFEQNLREQNSKQQEFADKMLKGGRKVNKKKKRPKRTAATMVKAKHNKTLDESINSSFDVSASEVASPITGLHAEMLEKALQSTKKVTPAKKVLARARARKRTPAKKTPGKKMHIKLPKSPAIKTKKNAKKNGTKDAKCVTKIEVPDSNTNNEQADRTNVENAINNEPDAATIEETKNISANTEDLEVAEHLLKLKDAVPMNTVATIESIPSNVIETNPTKDSINPPEVASTSAKPVEKPIEIITDESKKPELIQTKTTFEKLDSFHQYSRLNMASLLETPLKFGDPATFPKTPCVGFIPELATPLLKSTMHSLLDDSIMKNIEFPTPSFPITPGSVITPAKEVGTPRSDVMCGASNRPTDYSSSSSYYKPDESDGVDRNLQALLKSTRSDDHEYMEDLHSSDEIDVGTCEVVEERIESVYMYQGNDGYVVCQSIEVPSTSGLVNYSEARDTTQNSDTSSSSSSSSSSDSDTDSSGDSSDTSEDSSQSHSRSRLLKLSAKKGTPRKETPRKETPRKTVSDESRQTASIMSLIHHASPKPSTLLPPTVDPRIEQQALLKEKKLRVLNSLKVSDAKLPFVRAKGKIPNSVRNIAKARQEPLRAPVPMIAPSPSKRKLTQPRKIVGPSGARSTIFIDAKPLSKGTAKKPTKNEAVAIKAITSADDGKHKPAACQPHKAEESVDAIKKHITESTKTMQDIVLNEKSTSSAKIDNASLIKDLEGESESDQKASPKKSVRETPKTSTKKAKNPIIRTKSEPLNIAKSGESSDESKKSKNEKLASGANKSDNQISLSLGPQKPPDPNVSLSPGEITASPNCSLNTTSASFATPSFSAATPYKNPSDSQLRHLFGDFIDTPDKSTPIKSNIPQVIPQEALESIAEPLRSIESVEGEAVCDSTTADLSGTIEDSSSDDGEDDGTDECVIETVDENDSTRFIKVFSESTKKPDVKPTNQSFKKLNLAMEHVKFTLSVADEEELFRHDIVDSTATRIANLPRIPKKSTTEVKTPARAKPETGFGQPLKTSTPTPVKRSHEAGSFKPKFNIKPKFRSLEGKGHQR